MQRNFKQELIGCFGFPVAENPTQAMVEPAFRALGLDWRYLTLEVQPEDLEAAVAGARAFGFRGFNCTIPHKVEVIRHLDGLGESAALIGAVNCVVVRDGQWIGENTDGKGFVTSFRELSDPVGQSLVILGAGGAARAIAVEMALAGASAITIVNRSIDRGRELTALLEEKVLPLYPELKIRFSPLTENFSVPDHADVLINATSIGLYPDVSALIPIDLSTLRSGMLVADVIPNPPRTRLVRAAEECGCRVIDGIGMLVSQGVKGIEYWTGQSPDPAIMRAALEAVFTSDS